MRRSALALLMLLTGAAPAPVAAEIKPAVVFDIGGKHDRSFNEGVWEGVERFRRSTGIAAAEFEVTQEAQFEQAHRRFAQRGHDPIIGVGFSQANAVDKVAREFPRTRFTLIDATSSLPNVQSVLFREHEGSFLVGALAALATRSGKLGFVGGMDIPLIRKFACGYEQGARHVTPGIEVIQNMTGTTPTAWNDPARGAELARGQFDRGVDIVFAAAGGTGTGVYQAARDRGKLAIGVDSNQNHLHPGTMLTSMVKRVDRAAHDSFAAAREGSWKPGVMVLGLREGGVEWALDAHNAALVTPAMRDRMAIIRRDILAGAIAVHDSMTDNRCAP